MLKLLWGGKSGGIIYSLKALWTEFFLYENHLINKVWLIKNQNYFLPGPSLVYQKMPPHIMIIFIILNLCLFLLHSYSGMQKFGRPC